jgi:hypothetical protein
VSSSPKILPPDRDDDDKVSAEQFPAQQNGRSKVDLNSLCNS